MRRRVRCSANRWSYRATSCCVLLPVHPLPDVRRAMEQLDALCFAGDQEMDARDVHQRHLIEIKHAPGVHLDRKSTRLNSSHVRISYAVFCLKKKKKGPGIDRLKY